MQYFHEITIQHDNISFLFKKTGHIFMFKVMDHGLSNKRKTIT